MNSSVVIALDKNTLKAISNRVETSYDLPDGLEVGTKLAPHQFWIRNRGSLGPDSHEFPLFHSLTRFDKTQASDPRTLLSGCFSGAFYDEASSTWSTLSLGSYLNLHRESDPKKEAAIVFDTKNLQPKSLNYGLIV